MVTAGNQDAYAHSTWQSPWGNPNGAPPQWAPPCWHPVGLSRPAAIAFTVLGFMFWWPVGLAMLFCTIGSRRMGCFGQHREEFRAQREAWKAQKSAWKAWARGMGAPQTPPSSGNHAFDEYRAETLRRMEEEQKEFGSFLERLRFAKDKAEFDQFMAERRQQAPRPPEEPPHA